MAGLDENSWRTQTLRRSVLAKLDEAIISSGTPAGKTAIEMESHAFQKSKSKEEYLHIAARLILHIQQIRSLDPIIALQTLAQHGSSNAQAMHRMQDGPNVQGMAQQQLPNSTDVSVPRIGNQRPVDMQTANMQARPTARVNCIEMRQTQLMQMNAVINQIQQRAQASMVQTGQIPLQIQNALRHQMQSPLAAQLQMASRMQSPLAAQLQTLVGQTGRGQTPPQISHMQRKPELTNVGPRNAAPNQFLRQSSSASVPSPVNLAAPPSYQMVASPVLMPSSSPQHTVMVGPQRSVGMVPSPSSSLGTPGSVGPTPSPQDDATYREKVRQLSKYIEPLRQMITKMGSEGNVDKMAKMNRLLEILSNPTSRVPLETIIKCEMVLEKLNLKRRESSVGPVATTVKEHHFFSPLLEAVNMHLQNPMANHTLQRTFGPCFNALVGPGIKNLPSPLKKERVEQSTSEIPDVLQGEIARLDQRFKVSLDPTQQNGSKCIQLICWLDDRHLPCVPPVSVTVPSEYPHIPPRCVMAPHEYTTTFLSAVQKALIARITKLPERFSVSQLLDSWELSVRQACAPTQTAVSTSTVLLGV